MSNVLCITCSDRKWIFCTLVNNCFVLLLTISPRHLKYWVGVHRGQSYTSWGEGASLALVGHPSSDGVTIKMPYGEDVLHRPASHLIFS